MPKTVTFSFRFSAIWTTFPVFADPVTRELTPVTSGDVASTIVVTADVVVVLPASFSAAVSDPGGEAVAAVKKRGRLESPVGKALRGEIRRT